jgi:hypothetical protein
MIMNIDWVDIALKILLFALPLIISYIFGKLGITREKYQKYQWAVERAMEFVFAAKDKFPENSGVQKLAWATEQLRNALIKAGYHITTQESEAMVRAAYQKMRTEALEATVKGS